MPTLTCSAFSPVHKVGNPPAQLGQTLALLSLIQGVHELTAHPLTALRFAVILWVSSGKYGFCVFDDTSHTPPTRLDRWGTVFLR
jgi:hypothetical protein